MRVGEDELPSLEYIEDPYIPKLDNCLTPSLDDISEYNVEELLGDEQNWPEETEQYLRSLTLDQILGVSSDEDIDPDPDGFLEMQTVETEFSPQLADSRGNGASGATNLRAVEPGDGVGGAVMRNLLAHRLLNGRQASKLNQLFSKRRIRDVRVTFIDFSKPYLARISSGDNYKSFLNIGSATDNSGKLSDASPVGSVSSAEIAQEFSGLTVEEQEAQRAEWSQELARVEEEITTLRTVLQSKIRHAGELKRKLGITVWKEITDDMSQGIKNVKESNVYQKTETAIKTTAGKTTSVLGGFTSKLTGKISEMKQSDSFRSFEERVGSAYENVRSKVSSRSSSVQSLSDLQNDERRSSVTTPTAIPEEKTVP
ncbi:tumor protein D52 isoform X4 [Culex quinquefasciatus]|uniref:tumor protein D52 isoform X4 n=1 Tax=Culex quinquefasciatus TaxID=7176 RepID=UPI0018E33898|nr:tumor protein D52 isoform X4 [Culex quinquefasciatus]